MPCRVLYTRRRLFARLGGGLGNGLYLANGSAIAALLRDTARERGVTVIAATHDPTLAALSSRALAMTDGALAAGDGL